MLAPSRRPTATCTALSSRRSPQLESGSAWSQSPLCGDVTASSRALSVLSLKLFDSESRSDATIILSHADCLYAAVPDVPGRLQTVCGRTVLLLLQTLMSRVVLSRKTLQGHLTNKKQSRVDSDAAQVLASPPKDVLNCRSCNA